MEGIQKINDDELYHRLLVRHHMMFGEHRETERDENSAIYLDSYSTLIEKRRERFGPYFNAETFVRELSEIKKNALDYIKHWDAITVLMALNWLLVLKSTAIRTDFVEKLRLEYPTRNLVEALSEVTATWRSMKDRFGENRLMYDEDFYTYEKYKACPWLVDFYKLSFDNVRELRRGNVLFKDIIEGNINE